MAASPFEILTEMQFLGPIPDLIVAAGNLLSDFEWPAEHFSRMR
jgi:hypothetical protein